MVFRWKRSAGGRRKPRLKAPNDIRNTRFSDRIRAQTKRCTSVLLEHWDARGKPVHAHWRLSLLKGGARAFSLVGGAAAASAASAKHSSAVRRCTIGAPL